MLEGDPLDALIKSFGLAAVGLYALGIVLKYRPWEHKKFDEPNGGSGSKPVSFWREEVRTVIKDCLEEFDQGRMAKIREIIREELERQK
jgi:hypothetical protein